ncbi:MAG: methyltransferase family protein [Steroidobacteraceae bacterium]
MLVAILLMTGLHFVVPWVQLFATPWRLIGAVPVALGILLNMWADQLFKRAGTAVKPFEPSIALVVAGPFRFSRNPMYFGMVLVLAGIAIGLGSATPWLVVPLFVWRVTERFIVPEERKLEETVGQQYCEYKFKVRRWV